MKKHQFVYYHQGEGTYDVRAYQISTRLQQQFHHFIMVKGCSKEQSGLKRTLQYTDTNV